VRPLSPADSRENDGFEQFVATDLCTLRTNPASKGAVKMFNTLVIFAIPESLSAGFIAFLVFFGIAAVLFTMYCWWHVAQKCGYPGAYSLLLLIPVVNIIVQLIWIFSEWPIEAEVKRLRASARQPIS
jgi:hypothetical protein